MRFVPPEDRRDLEDPGRNGAAGEACPERLRDGAQLDAPLLREAANRLLDRALVPGSKRIERLRKRFGARTSRLRPGVSAPWRRSEPAAP